MYMYIYVLVGIVFVLYRVRGCVRECVCVCVCLPLCVYNYISPPRTLSAHCEFVLRSQPAACREVIAICILMFSPRRLRSTYIYTCIISCVGMRVCSALALGRLYTYIGLRVLARVLKYT